jgi:intracellular septation protein
MVIKNFLLSLAIEFGPTVTFFLGATLKDFFFGVWCLIIATILSMTVSLIRDKRVPLFSLIASSFVLLSGVITLFTLNPYWIVIEYTIYNLFFATAIGIGWFKNKPALKPLFHTMFNVTDKGWHILSLRWGVFFVLGAIGSEYVWYTYSEEIWVLYRFVMSIVLAIFGFSQFFLVRKHRMPDASPWGLRIHS